MTVAAESRPRSRQRGRFRRLGKVARFIAALAFVGATYTAFSPGIYADEPTDSALSLDAQKGKEIFDQSCISCHGPDAQGVEDRGPSLIGVGSAAVEFQVNTGRMPMARQEAQALRKPPMFTPEEAAFLGAYIQAIGGGPEVPSDVDLDNLEGADVANGGTLFRVNCSSCHAFSTGGGALSSGKFAPDLHPASAVEIYQAMLSGPQNMPVFADNQLTPDQKRDLIAYIKYIQDDQAQGGWDLGAFGPSTEGLAIFLVGIVALAIATLWIAGKS
ncbi:MAG TPA: cytochrome c [Phytomonospora sp.]